MIPKENELEQQVQTVLKNLLGRYQQLDELADAMLGKQADQQEFGEELLKVDAVKVEIKQVEEQTAEIRNRYIASRKHSSEEVQELTRKAGELLIIVMKKIEQLETHTQEAFQRLVPQVNENVRANQMKQAYGNSRV